MTKTKNTKPSTAKNDYPSFQPRITPTQILFKFATKQANMKERHSGEIDNTHLNDFVTVMQFIIENQKSFCRQDLLSLTRSLDTPANYLIPLFNQFCEELITHDRCKQVEGAYDYPVWQLT